MRRPPGPLWPWMVSWSGAKTVAVVVLATFSLAQLGAHAWSIFTYGWGRPALAALSGSIAALVVVYAAIFLAIKAGGTYTWGTVVRGVLTAAVLGCLTMFVAGAIIIAQRAE